MVFREKSFLSPIFPGNGATAPFQSEIRNGLDGLLDEQKQAARLKKLGWKLVPCGGRDQAHKAFINRVQQSTNDTVVVLLVDSEEGLPAELPQPKKETPQTKSQRLLNDAQARKDHLVTRDKWDLKNVSPVCVHLMVRCMEAWIAADPKALADYYGKGFNAQKLPASPNLENEPKLQLYAKIENATKQASKGAYAKIKHASKLLGLIDPKKVAARCPRFATFTDWLTEQINNA